jgi:hypothetical protein
MMPLPTFNCRLPIGLVAMLNVGPLWHKATGNRKTNRQLEIGNRK